MLRVATSFSSAGVRKMQKLPRAWIRTQRELETIIENNPLIDSAGVRPDKLHVTFLSDTPDETVTSTLDIKLDQGEKFVIVDTEVYLYCPNGYARTKLNNAMFETKLKTAATRNWKTINKLLVISKLSLCGTLGYQVGSCEDSVTRRRALQMRTDSL